MCTNGTYLKNNSEVVKQIISNNVWLDICIHDPAHYDSVQHDVEKIIADLDFEKVVTANHDIGYHSFDVIEYYSKGQVICKISKQWNFSKNSTKKIENGIIVMHENDPETAHKNCAAKYCNYFVKGKLYKCYLTGVSTELVQQFNIDSKSKELLLKYKAYSPGDDVSNINSHIPQCSLCSDKTESYPIWPLATTKVKQ